MYEHKIGNKSEDRLLRESSKPDLGCYRQALHGAFSRMQGSILLVMRCYQDAQAGWRNSIVLRISMLKDRNVDLVLINHTVDLGLMVIQGLM